MCCFCLSEKYLSLSGREASVYVLGFLCLGSEKKSKYIVLMFPGICIVVTGRAPDGVCCQASVNLCTDGLLGPHGRRNDLGVVGLIASYLVNEN